MNLLRTGVFVMVMLFSFGVKAQITKDPTTWTVEAKKTGVNSYDIIFHLKLQPKWHIFSLNPGGDGMQLPPEFKMDKVKMNGAVKEKGRLVSGKLEGVRGNVNYYEGSVDYVQPVAGTAGTKVSGSYRYQVCNDEMCLAPKTKKFEVTLR